MLITVPQIAAPFDILVMNDETRIAINIDEIRVRVGSKTLSTCRVPKIASNRSCACDRLTSRRHSNGRSEVVGRQVVYLPAIVPSLSRDLI